MQSMASKLHVCFPAASRLHLDVNAESWMDVRLGTSNCLNEGP